MPDDPADVRGAEYHVAGAVDAEEVFDGEVEADCVAACFSKDAFREAGCTYCVWTSARLPNIPLSVTV